MELKLCTTCKEAKPLSEFHRNRRNRDGLHAQCKPCNNAISRAWQQANRERYNATRRAWKARNAEKVKASNNASARRNYVPRSTTDRARKARVGLEPGDYQRMYEAQKGECAICGSRPEVLDIDHCHDTGRIRGLLCRKCNTGIGLLGDRPDGVASALIYLTME